MQATCWLLLACTAAIAASAAAQNASAKSSADVIVVGAGVSGLSAAAALQAAGYSVIVVEARDRLGGRLHTVSFNKTKGKVDLGGAWMHGLDGNPITKVADTNQLSYVPTSTTDGTAYWSNGTELPEALATQQEQLLTGLKGYNSKWIDSQEGASAGVNTSLADLMTEFTDSKSLGGLQQLLLAAAVDGAVVAEYAASPGNLSARYYDDNKAFDGDDAVFPEGYVGVVEAIARGVSDIRLQHVVTNVTYNSSGVQVTATAPSGPVTLSAKAAIITLPLGVLKARAAALFSPPLPADKQRAIEALGMGLLNKVILLYDKPFWDNTAWISRVPTTLDAPITSSQRRATEIFNLGKYLPGVPALVAFLGGDPAWAAEGATDQDLTDEVSAALRQLYPDAPAAPKEALITRWGQDPYALGSYSFMAVGSTPADTAALAAPVSNVLFWAGEATRRDYPSTVHGAYLSGQAAATAVQKAVQASSGGSGAGGGAASASNGTRNAAARVQPSVWGQVLLLLVWVGAGLWQLV